MVTPETRYARSGDVAVAYQVLGEGPFDVVFVPGTTGPLDTKRHSFGAAQERELAAVTVMHNQVLCIAAVFGRGPGGSPGIWLDAPTTLRRARRR
jgi:hypothetical protein